MTTYGSLCTGVAQLDRAVEAVFDVEMAWFAETDKDVCQVLERLHPDVPNLGDITAADWSAVEPVECLVAGYPCQPFSVAGRQEGFDDERDLWPHIARAIGVLRPSVVVLENVAGHLRLGFDRTLADLAVLGFDAEWALVRASDAGACHRRERLFALAYSDGEGRATLERPTGARLGRSRRSAAPDAAGTSWRLAGCASQTANGPEALERPRRRDRFPWGPYGAAITRHESVCGPAPWPVVEGTASLSGDFTAWMMGIPPGTLDGISNSAKKRLCGNAVFAPAAELALRLLVKQSEG